MNTVRSTVVDEQTYKHPPSWFEAVSRTRTVSLADRAALHIGLALITWSRRPRTTAASSSDELRTLRHDAITRATREREWQLALYLSQLHR